jgi:hypothetical protein
VKDATERPASGIKPQLLKRQLLRQRGPLPGAEARSGLRVASIALRAAARPGSRARTTSASGSYSGRSPLSSA